MKTQNKTEKQISISIVENAGHLPCERFNIWDEKYIKKNFLYFAYNNIYFSLWINYFIWIYWQTDLNERKYYRKAKMM